MPGPDAALGGVLGPEVQCERRGQVRNCGDQALLEDVELGSVDTFEARDDGGQEEPERVQAVDEAEVDCREHPDPAVAEDCADADVPVAGGGFLLFLLQCTGQPGLFLLRQPLGLGGGVSQVEPGDDANDDGGDGDAEEHDAPAGESEESVLLDEEAGQRGTDHGGERLGQVEEGEDLAAVPGRNPEAQEEDGAGEEAGFCHTQDETQYVELLHVAHPGEQQGDDAPADHDAGEPAAGAELVQCQVARDLEQDVADEEDAGGEPELSRRKGQIVVHAVGAGKGDGRPVKVVDEEHQGDERHQPDCHFPDCRFFDHRLCGVHVDS
ncbi:hypothetical protein D9M72_435470 [compost metagenome]